MNTRDEIIYIVDDEAGMQKALTRLFRAEGFEVRAFSSAQEFIDAHRAGEIACLILDVAMPGLDGIALQHFLLASGVHVPIVFLTGRGDIPMSVRAIKAGAVDFLTKPVNDTELLRAVHTALALAKSHQAEHAELSALAKRYATLTPREREVMTHVVSGQLNKQIAADLGTGEQNIKIHRGHVMSKMGVVSIADLVRAAGRLTIVKIA